MMEYWNDGLKEERQLNMIFSAFGTHYSIIPIFPGPDPLARWRAGLIIWAICVHTWNMRQGGPSFHMDGIKRVPLKIHDFNKL